MLNIHVNTLLDFLNFFWPTVDLPTCKESLLGERRARLGHVHGIGRIGLRLVASEKIGPTSRNGKPLEWRSCRVTRSLWSIEQGSMPDLIRLRVQLCNSNDSTLVLT